MSLEGWRTFFEIGGVTLIFITFVFAAGAVLTGRWINRIQAAELRKLDKQLTDAKTELGKQQERAAKAEVDLKNVANSAGSANLRAAEANERATKAQESLALAEQHAAEANAKAEGFRLDIARANETAERERLARLQLEARLADRTLTPVQQTAITAQLSTVPGIVVDVITFGDTPEIQTISGLVLDSIRRAGWTINPAQAGGGGAAVRGILVGTRTGSDANTVRAANLLVSALQSVGLAAGPWAFDQLQPPGILFNSAFRGTAPIRMFIGSKP